MQPNDQIALEDFFNSLKSEVKEEVNSYGIHRVTGHVKYLIKSWKTDWEDALVTAQDGASILEYQNCREPAWQTKVRPALNRTPDNARIVVKFWPNKAFCVVTKRDILQEENGISTFTRA